MPNRYPAEQRERATRVALDRLDEYGSTSAVAQASGPKLGVGPETRRKWVMRAPTDAGSPPGPMRGLTTTISLHTIAAGPAFVPNLRRGHYENTGDCLSMIVSGSRSSNSPAVRRFDQKRAPRSNSARERPRQEHRGS